MNDLYEYREPFTVMTTRRTMKLCASTHYVCPCTIDTQCGGYDAPGDLLENSVPYLCGIVDVLLARP
jgi:hypothetical protein